MERLTIEGTKSSPFIDLDPNSNIHIIKGESYPENSISFYKPILEWLERYLEQLETKAVFNFELIYFNSSSSKILMDLFDMLDEACKSGKEIEINWICDAEDDVMSEYGEEFAEDLECVTFHIKEK